MTKCEILLLMALLIVVIPVVGIAIGRRLRYLRETTTLPVDEIGRPVLDLNDPGARMQLGMFLSQYRIEGDARISELLENAHGRPVDRP